MPNGEPATLETIAVAIGVLQTQMTNMSGDVDEIKKKFDVEHEANSKVRTTVAVLKGQISLSRWLIIIIGSVTLGIGGILATMLVA